MINIIENYKTIKKDKDLIYTKYLAYQYDRTKSIEYNEGYFDNYVNLSGSEIALKLNKFRTSLVEKYCKKCIIDIGIGSGEFISSCKKIKVFGYDINPVGVKWLEKRKLFLDPYKDNNEDIEGFTLWDTIEHMSNPCEFLDKVNKNQYLFISLPIFKDINKVKESKHYKPNEHYYYFSKDGFVKFMEDNDFELKEISEEETKIGRNNITSFVFIKQ